MSGHAFAASTIPTQEIPRSEDPAPKSPSKSRRAALSFEEIGSRALDTTLPAVKKPKTPRGDEKKLVLSFSAIGNQAIHDGHNKPSVENQVPTDPDPSRTRQSVQSDHRTDILGQHIINSPNGYARGSSFSAEIKLGGDETKEELEAKTAVKDEPAIEEKEGSIKCNKHEASTGCWDEADASLESLRQRGGTDGQGIPPLPLEAYLVPDDTTALSETRLEDLETKRKEEEQERKQEELLRKTKVMHGRVEELELLSQPSVSTEVEGKPEEVHATSSLERVPALNAAKEAVTEVSYETENNAIERKVVKAQPVMRRPEGLLQRPVPRLPPAKEVHRIPPTATKPIIPQHDLHSQVSFDEEEEEKESARVLRRLAPPSKKILQFAEYLGMDPDTDREYFWIAEECLYASLPKGWRQARDGVTKRNYYWSEEDPQNRQWEHPLDPLFRALFIQLKAEKNQREEENHGDDILLVATQRKLLKKRLGLVRPLSARSDSSGTLAKGIGLELLRQSFSGEEILEKLREQERKNVPQPTQPPFDQQPKPGFFQTLFSRGSSYKIIPSADVSAVKSEDSEHSELDLTKEEKMRSIGVSIALASIRLLPEINPRPYPKLNVIDHHFLLEFAAYIGIALPRDADLMWIAKLAALAPVPDDWRLCYNEYTNETYYVSEATLEITKNHPLDQFFALLGKCILHAEVVEL